MPLFRRPDGALVTDVPATRRIMPFIMPTRTESAVYFEQELDLTRTLPFLERFNAEHLETRAGLFHLFTWAAVRALHRRPRLNRFVVGSHLYQRDGIWVSYSAKKSMSDDAPVVVLKRRFDPDAGFAALVTLVHGDLTEGRSDRQSHVDRELGLFLALPAPLLRLGVRLLRWLDTWNLLPGGFIHPDPLYASLFIANLGSVKLESGFHHLYEYGNIPIFAAIGLKREVMTPAGVKTVCSVKYTLDERIEDGLYCAQSLELLRHDVENPEGAR
ncbi:MAG: hypothetical protein IPJ65_17475 [Archangiaceae bacterium]|nr:hypothetical protein [Archangiaceae bacterium]